MNYDETLDPESPPAQTSKVTKSVPLVANAGSAPASTPEPNISWLEYEHLAAAAMRRLGFVDAAVTAQGVDGGVDVRAREALAQVKARVTASSRPEVQQLHGVAKAEGKIGFFFSAAGYTAGAIEWAEVARVALFVLEPSGLVKPIGSFAEELHAKAAISQENVQGGGIDGKYGSGATFGSMLSNGDMANLLVHIPSGEKAVVHGRMLANLVASKSDVPSRVIDAGALGEGNGIPLAALQYLKKGEVVYLDRIELFPEDKLLFLLRVFTDGLQLTRNSEALDEEPPSPIRIVKPLDEGALVERNRELLARSMFVAEIGKPQGSIFSDLQDLNTNSSRVISGSELARVGDLAAIMTSMHDEDVLIIDEIHRLSEPVEELLIEVVNTGKFSFVTGSGLRDRSCQLEFPSFVVVGTTEDVDALSPRLREALGGPISRTNGDYGFEAFRTAVTAKLIEVEAEKQALILENDWKRKAVEDTVKDVWDKTGSNYTLEALQVVVKHAGLSRRSAFYLAHQLVRFSQINGQLQKEQAIQLVEKLAFDDTNFTDSDWLLLDWAVGAADASLGNPSVLPPVQLIASTCISWDHKRDVRKALGKYSTSFTFRLVLPEVRSTNQATLFYELENVPLIV